MAGPQDVQGVDLFHAGLGDADLGAVQNHPGQRRAACRGQGLAVGKACGDGLGVQHHGGGEDRASQRAAPDLVHARDDGQAARTDRLFKDEIRGRYARHGGTPNQVHGARERRKSVPVCAGRFWDYVMKRVTRYKGHSSSRGRKLLTLPPPIPDAGLPSRGRGAAP